MNKFIVYVGENTLVAFLQDIYGSEGEHTRGDQYDGLAFFKFLDDELRFVNYIRLYKSQYRDTFLSMSALEDNKLVVLTREFLAIYESGEDIKLCAKHRFPILPKESFTHEDVGVMSDGRIVVSKRSKNETSIELWAYAHGDSLNLLSEIHLSGHDYSHSSYMLFAGGESIALQRSEFDDNSGCVDIFRLPSGSDTPQLINNPHDNLYKLSTSAYYAASAVRGHLVSVVRSRDNTKAIIMDVISLTEGSIKKHFIDLEAKGDISDIDFLEEGFSLAIEVAKQTRQKVKRSIFMVDLEGNRLGAADKNKYKITYPDDQQLVKMVHYGVAAPEALKRTCKNTLSRLPKFKMSFAHRFVRELSNVMNEQYPKEITQTLITFLYSDHSIFANRAMKTRSNVQRESETEPSTLSYPRT